MAERVPIAHFADPQTANLAAQFLGHHRVDAAFLDKSSFRAPAGGIVLVAKDEAVCAVALLHRVKRGDFAHASLDQTVAESEIAAELTHALRGLDITQPMSALRDVVAPFALIAMALATMFLAPVIWDWVCR